MGESNTRVTIVDRHELLVGVVEHALARHGYRCHGVVVEQAGTRAVVADVGRSHPDVVLAGVSPGDAEGANVLDALHQVGHLVVALVDRDDPRQLGEALAAGAVAVFARSSSLEALLDVLARTLRGEVAIDAGRRDELIRRYQTGLGKDAVKLARLTVQERELLADLMEGHTVSDVAHARFVSEATVRTQAKAVLAKLEVSSQLTAVAVAWQAGFTPSALRVHGRAGRRVSRPAGTPVRSAG